MIHNVFEFADLTAREIMIPRTEVVALEQRAGFEDVVRQFQVSGYSRLPVYNGNFDQIVGVLDSKDVMPFLLKKGEFDLEKVMRQPIAQSGRHCRTQQHEVHGGASRESPRHAREDGAFT